jgi:hypothetical protein
MRAEYEKGRRALHQATGARLPRNPTLQDALRMVQITAGGHASGEPVVGQISIPDDVRATARQALREAWTEDYGAWWFIGIARALQLAYAPGISREGKRRMRNFLQRSKKRRHKGRGRLAWLVWGGDAAARWLNVKL